MMLALIKKDLRVFLTPTVGGVVLITCGYLIALSLYLFGSSTTQLMLGDWLAQAASVGLSIVVLLASAYGGSSFAVERREHSSDWLNMLPATRRQIVASKFVAAFACMAALCIYDLLPIAVLSLRNPTYGQIHSLVRAFMFFSPMFFALLALCWILFGFAWLFSTFLESAAISACIAILMVFMGLFMAEGLHHVLTLRQSTLVVIVIVTGVMGATASFVLGTYYYLNRVES